MVDPGEKKDAILKLIRYFNAELPFHELDYSIGGSRARLCIKDKNTRGVIEESYKILKLE